MPAPIQTRIATALSLAVVFQTAAHAARVAILLDSPTQTLPQAVSIAEAQLSDPNSGVTLVERQAIDRVLVEQKLTESLGNADHAVAIGKLVSAEVLAVVEPTTDGKQVDGLVVFDGETGVRLEDVTLPVEPAKAAALIASTIKDSVVKRDLPIAQRRSVCLMTIRNADLPMESSGICPALGKLLERRLTNSSAVTVLERSRLDKVNQERALPTASDRIKDLTATLTAMELQVSREGQDQIKLTCILSDPTGKALGSPSVTGHATDLAKLTDALSDIICKSLSTTPVVNQGDRHIEAARFLAEARFRWSHRQRVDALEDAQAAFALDPDSPANQAGLMRGLIERGAEKTGGFADTNDPTHVQLFPVNNPTEQDIDTSLLLVKLSADMLLAHPPAVELKPGVPTVDSVDWDRALTTHLLQAYLTAVGCQLFVAPTPQGIHSLKMSEPELANFAALRAAYRHLRMDLQQPDAMALVHDQPAFDAYTAYLLDLLSDSGFCFSKSRQEWLDDEEKLISQWMDLGDKFDPVSRNPNGRRPPGNPYGNGDNTSKLLNAMTNTWLSGQVSWMGIDFPFKRQSVPNEEMSDQQLDQLERILARLGGRRERTYATASQRGISWVSRTRWEKSRRGIPIPPRRYPEPLSAAITPTRGPTVAKQAQQNTSAGAGLFWKEARTLVDAISTKQPIRRIIDPVVFDKMVYCAAFSDEPQGPTLEVLKFDPLTGKTTVLGRHVSSRYAGEIVPRPGSMHDRLSEQSYSARGFIADSNYVIIGGNSDAVLVYPLAGGDPQVIDQSKGLEWQFVYNATMLKGTLYAKVRDGTLIELDPATHQYQTLASSERKEHLTPFDDTVPFDVPVMLSDPQHQRIVLYAGSGRWPASRCGLYVFSLKTRTFTQLTAPDQTKPAATQSTQPGTRLAQSASVVHWGGDTLISVTIGASVSVFDLEKDKFVDVPWKDVPNTINDTVSTFWPHAPQGPWIWTAVNLGKRFSGHAGLARIDTDKKRLQVFPAIRPVEISEGMWPVNIQQIDDERMLIGDQYGLWVVAPPEGFASPDSAMDEASGAVAAATTLAPPPSGAQLPWESGKTLYDYLLQPGYDFVARPLAAGKFVYAVGLGHSGPDDHPTQAYARLLKISIADATLNELGAVTMNSPAWNTQVFFDTQQGIHHGDRIKSSNSFVQATVLTGDRLYCKTNAGLMEFPLDGSPGRTVSPKTPLPQTWDGSLAYLDGQLYLASALTKSIQVYDQSNNTLHSIPPEGAPDAAPFDADMVRVPFVFADSGQHRLLLVACDNSKQCSNGGIWSYDPQTKKFSKLLALFLSTPGRSMDLPNRSVGFIWANMIDNRMVLISTSRGFFSFDILTNTVRRIQQSYADIDVLAPTSQPTQTPAEAVGNDLLAGSISFNTPVTMDDKWIWCAFPWTRVSRDGKTWQAFPALRPGDNNFVPNESIQLLDDSKHLLVADSMACWVLNLQTAMR